MVCVTFDRSQIDQISDSSVRVINGIPIDVLKEAALQVFNERFIQNDIQAERMELTRDGVFIPLLKFDLSSSNGSSTRSSSIQNTITGGIQAPKYQNISAANSGCAFGSADEKDNAPEEAEDSIAFVPHHSEISRASSMSRIDV